jgi:glycerol-3-phosphate acyltransferase PlsY
MMTWIMLIVAAYLLGSVPFGLFIAKAHGKDLRAIGSGNIGATNTGRVLGKKWGVICLVLDCMKGFIPTFAARSFVSAPPAATQLWLWLAVGCAAVIGHIFPVYLKFKGGKGVATSLGMVLGLFPYYTVAGAGSLIIWIALVLVWRYISLASIIATTLFPVLLVAAIAINKEWTFGGLWPLLVMALLMPMLVIIRHAENIKRLLDGSEMKVLQKK